MLGVSLWKGLYDYEQLLPAHSPVTGSAATKHICNWQLRTLSSILSSFSLPHKSHIQSQLHKAQTRMVSRVLKVTLALPVRACLHLLEMAHFIMLSHSSDITRA